MAVKRFPPPLVAHYSIEGSLLHEKHTWVSRRKRAGKTHSNEKSKHYQCPLKTRKCHTGQPGTGSKISTTPSYNIRVQNQRSSRALNSK
jgi:hypothetical protein